MTSACLQQAHDRHMKQSMGKLVRALDMGHLALRCRPLQL